MKEEQGLLLCPSVSPPWFSCCCPGFPLSLAKPLHLMASTTQKVPGTEDRDWEQSQPLGESEGLGDKEGWRVFSTEGEGRGAEKRMGGQTGSAEFCTVTWPQPPADR